MIIDECRSPFGCSWLMKSLIFKNIRVDFVCFGDLVRSIWLKPANEIGGGPREVPRGSSGGLGGTQNRRSFFGASRQGPGQVSVWYWCSGVVLGSVLGRQNVDISMVSVMLERYHFFFFFVDFETCFVFTSKGTNCS